MLTNSAAKLEPVDDDWLSISAIAQKRGVTRQRVWKKVKELSEKGVLPIRGSGKSLRVHAPTYFEIMGASHDPAQDLRNRHLAAPPPPLASAPAQEPFRPSNAANFDEAATREKHAKASLAELDLARRRGELIPAADIQHAAIECGTLLAQNYAGLKAKSGQLYAAAINGGEDALRAVLSELISAGIAQIHDSMTKLAAHAAVEED